MKYITKDFNKPSKNIRDELQMTFALRRYSKMKQGKGKSLIQ